MYKKLLAIAAAIGIVIALWPAPAGRLGPISLYSFTGEEALPGQLVGIINWMATAIRPQPQLAADAVSADNDVPLFGMNVFLQWEVLPEVVEEAYQQLNAAGIGIVRQQFSWEDIEIHAKDDFIDRRNDPSGVDAWAKYDNLVEMAAQYDIEIMARLDNPPAWSRAVGNGVEERDAKGPPDDFNDYGDFVAAVVGRYAGQITYFQLWNEPNIFDEWGDKSPNPEEFTQLLCIGYDRAKAANPNAVIVGPALAPTVENINFNMNDLAFLQRMYQAGAADCFDVMSTQGYGLWSGPTDHRLQPTIINYPHHLLIRDVMVANGDEAKPVWISEAGWNSVPDGLPQIFGQATEEQRAKYAVELYQRAQVEWPWVQSIHYWFLKRPAPEADQPFYYFRLMEPDFTPSPTFDALKGYITSGDYPESQPLIDGDYRPILFTFSIATLFFLLIQATMPPVTHDD